MVVPLSRHTRTTDATWWYQYCDRQYAPSNQRWPLTSRHGVTSQKIQRPVVLFKCDGAHTHTRTHTRASSRSILKCSTNYLSDVIRHCYRQQHLLSLSTCGTTMARSEIRNMRTLFICDAILCVDCSAVLTAH